MKKFITLIAILALFQGCAHHRKPDTNTGIVSMNNNSFMIVKTHPGKGLPINLKIEVYKEANIYCAQLNKTVQTIAFDMQPGHCRIPANVSLQFTCKEKENES